MFLLSTVAPVAIDRRRASPGASSDALRQVAFADPNDVLRTLGSQTQGLSENEVERRREEFGRNEVAHEKPPAWYAQLAHAFANPFNLLLTTLAIVSGVTGDEEAVVVIGLMVLVSTVLRFIQEFRSTQSAEALRKLVRTSATVERADDEFAPGLTPGTKRREIPMDELVPGDIAYLSAGDMVPADVRLLTAKDLFVSQAALTGEALPIEKSDCSDGAAPNCAITEIPTICFMGTNVISGSATAVVVATGSRTSFGAMAKGLVGQRATTAFDVGVNKVSWLFIKFIAVMVPVVFVINGVSKGNWLEAFLFGLAIAVGLTPEMLPMIVTTNLAKGAVAMSRRKTIVKRLNSIQNFGAMDVLCTDKTGTLTQDKIVLERHVNVVGEEDDWVLGLTYINSFHQTGLKNLLDVAVLEHAELQKTIGIDRAYAKVDEIPFDFARRRMSVVVDYEHREHQLICKGAVEEMLSVCRWVRDEDPTVVEWSADRRRKIVPLDRELVDDARELVAEMNEDGFRVVAVAYRDFDRNHGPYSVADECDLVLAGFIGFLDPPKESAAPAIRALAEYGVRVKILTGDNDLVARKVCRDVGLDVDRIVIGGDIQGVDDAALGEIADRGIVFARLTPDDKVRIVRALKGRGHTVGFLGDGINDAGALREADVGVSVDSAVDIAKESADIILLEKSLMVLEEGVVEGRKTFGNTIKYIKMTASSNFGNVFSVLIASAFLPFLPMLPIQLLTLNLLYDFSQTSIPWDNMDAEYLEKPRQWRADDIGRFMVFVGPTSSVFDIGTFIVMWYVFGATTPTHQALFQSGWFIESLLTQTLIVHMIRTAKVPFLQSRAAAPVLLLTGLIMLIGVLLPFSSIGEKLELTPLPGSYFLWLVAILFGYSLLTQLVKHWYMRRFRTWL
ncbi:MAG TPA: magnesium-translocating P-type ATPase [Gemmatimonadaceae bacterium]|nr:magnesium-translocating P-type ATPase [Gemmatimonadaceae bacterium]